MQLKQWKVFQPVDPAFLKTIKCAITVGCSGPTVDPVAAVMVTTNDDVYSIGQNLQGCLGVPKPLVTKIPIKLTSLSQKSVEDLYAGFGHVIARTSQGQLHSWGDNKFCQLGHKKSDIVGDKLTRRNFISQPCIITGDLEDKNVTHVACGFNHTLALTSDGDVFGWGYNKADGRVGCGSDNAVISMSTKIKFSEENCKIVTIACGRHFSLALSEDGHLFSWGSNDYGQLGRNDSGPSFAPKKIQVSSVLFKQIACGSFHSLALSRDNQLYSWGQHILLRNARAIQGSLSRSENQAHHWLPPLRMADELEPIDDIAATFLTPISVIKSRNGIYVWGRCLEGFLDTPLKTNYHCIDQPFAFCTANPVMWRAKAFDTSLNPAVNCWQRLLEKEEGYDIEFVIDLTEVKAHRLLILARSQSLAKFVNLENGHQSNTGATQKIIVSNAKPDAFKAFIFYLYTDLISVETVDDAIDLLKLASSYKEKDLHFRCQQVLKWTITLQNVVHLYGVAGTYSAEILKDSCVDFAAKNFSSTNMRKGRTLTPGASNVWVRMMKEVKRKQGK